MSEVPLVSPGGQAMQVRSIEPIGQGLPQTSGLVPGDVFPLAGAFRHRRQLVSCLVAVRVSPRLPAQFVCFLSLGRYEKGEVPRGSPKDYPFPSASTG